MPPLVPVQQLQHKCTDRRQSQSAFYQPQQYMWLILLSSMGLLHTACSPQQGCVAFCTTSAAATHMHRHELHCAIVVLNVPHSAWWVSVESERHKLLRNAPPTEGCAASSTNSAAAAHTVTLTVMQKGCLSVTESQKGIYCSVLAQAGSFSRQLCYSLYSTLPYQHT